MVLRKTRKEMVKAKSKAGRVAGGWVWEMCSSVTEWSYKDENLEEKGVQGSEVLASH